MMVDTSSSLHARHDAETFRVAEELMMLSSLAPTPPSIETFQNGSPSNISGFFERSDKEALLKQTAARPKPHAAHRKRHHGIAGRNQLVRQIQKKRQTASPKVNRRLTTLAPPIPVHKTSDDGKNVINSQCDVEPSVLLQEHRSRCRHARRRWNLAHSLKKREYVARFQVQGVPLVKHLEALARWR